VGLAGVGVLAATLVVVGSPALAGAAPVTPSHFKPAPAGAKINNKPLGVANQQITVMVQMAGDPVTVADANAATPLTKAQRDAKRAALRSAQLPAETKARSLGGKVLGNYQSAYNGFKVRIAADKVSDLSAIPNVIGVHLVRTFKPDNIHGVPLIGAPQVWDGLNGYHGEGVKVAILDTGIDYTHADFGGPGTVAAYQAALASDTAPADPSMFGPDAPKVKGGIDLVGDAYNADPSSPDYSPTPVPDSNPLDCNQHGTHVAGTAAGFGVTADGHTYTGAYNDTTVSGHDWLVGPGVAPKADLYAVRVFGCEGSTDVVVDAIEWAVNNGMDVINMSLGSPWGDADDPEAVAASNAAKDGVIVVSAAGNDAQTPYMESSPASGTDVLSVAASDPTESYPGANITLTPGGSSTAIDANGVAFSPQTLPVIVLRDSSGGISLGCDAQEYVNANVAGKLVVTKRGTCARVARAIFGQQAGAAAVVMVNNATSLPPYEGPITSNPDTGVPYNVTIPFFGVSSNDASKWLAADGGTAALAPSTIANPGYLAPASFTSGGPRNGDSWLKPEVTAPGVSIFSAGMGTGNSFSVLSGTSMATPHTAGMAALVRQAHPKWKQVKYLKAAIENTSDPSKVGGYTTRVAGTGLIQAPGATETEVVALGNGGSPALNYGFTELTANYSNTKTVTLHNFGTSAASFDLSTGRDSGSAHSVSLSSTHVTVPAKGTASVDVTLSVPYATAGTATDSRFDDVAGLVTFTPTGGSNHGVALRVPYYLVPQTVSQVRTSLNADKLAKVGAAIATTTNGGVAGGTADWYAWGLTDPTEKSLAGDDIVAVGAQAWNGGLAFAIDVANRVSNPSDYEYDVYVDVNGDGKDDYDVVAVNFGLITAGTPDGQFAVAVIDLRSGDGSIEFLADATYDGSTIVLPVLTEQLCADGSPCLSPSNPRLTYHVVAFGETDGSMETVAGKASFNAFSPAITTGIYDAVAPGAHINNTVTVNSTEWAQTPAKGLMIITHDNKSNSETQLIGVTVTPSH
jgi:minor extracellular serine protease Vpr